MKKSNFVNQIKAFFLLLLNWRKLGPIQRKWISSLIIHPERQMKGVLGRKKKMVNTMLVALEKVD
jgi:hypothetical protein